MKTKAKTKPKPQPKKTYRKQVNGRPVVYRYELQNGRYVPVPVEAS